MSGKESSRLEIPFAKMQALGNDFVFIAEDDLKRSEDGKHLLDSWDEQKGNLARVLCDRRFGIGADGLILVKKSTRPDCLTGWSYTNSDGSSSAMCGNGIRCLALWLSEREVPPGKEFMVDTEIGAVPVIFESEERITSDLGEPVLRSERIPLSTPRQDKVVQASIALSKDINLIATCLSMGNPHCVIFEQSFDTQALEEIASKIQRHSLFPEGVNVEFAQVKSPQRASVEVWERGAGRTLACATGAAAVLVAGVLENRLERMAQIDLPGGTLYIEWSDKDDHVRITGPAKFVFSGSIDLSPLLSKLSS